MSAAPVVVTGLSGVTAIDAGGYHTCALLTGGAVRCWGNGVEGELGNGSTTTSVAPVTPTGLNSGVTAIAAGNTHSCALLTNGSLAAGGKTEAAGWGTV
jgi:alpha-tubulin suppressor-like RCC1 family protein